MRPDNVTLLWANAGDRAAANSSTLSTPILLIIAVSVRAYLFRQWHTISGHRLLSVRRMRGSCTRSSTFRTYPHTCAIASIAVAQYRYAQVSLSVHVPLICNQHLINLSGKSMNIRHLEYFVILSDELHFRRTAERLGITQAPLSLGIQALENELGARL